MPDKTQYETCYLVSGSDVNHLYALLFPPNFFVGHLESNGVYCHSRPTATYNPGLLEDALGIQCAGERFKL